MTDAATPPRVRAGMLLVASPSLVDPNFDDTVVLLLDADAEGALGVVLNRPTSVPVAEVLADWRDVVAEPDVLFQGGPVSPDGALAVGLAVGPSPLGFRPVGSALSGTPSTAGALEDSAAEPPAGPRLGLVDLDTPVELVAGGLRALRIFAGYAGWGAGQLEAEVEEGSWYVVAGSPGDVFAKDTSDLRRQVLRRQPGQLAWASTRPVDPELN